LGEVIPLRRDPWLSKRQLASEWGCSVRYVEARLSDGMPSRLVAGKRQFQRSVVEAWMRENGHLEDGAA
jgi:hypothetical protein